MKENIYLKKSYNKMMGILIYFILFLFTSAITSDENNIEKLDTFLKAPTEEAQNQLKYFKSTELQTIWNSYKNEKTLEEQRKLWLIEEYFKRESDRIASDRLMYLFWAVLLLLSFIFGTLIFLYYKQTALSKKLE